jgi:transposase-like protein
MYLIGGELNMRLQLILPRVEPGEIEIPEVCPYEGCEGRHFRHHQEVDKPLKDTRYDSVTAHRYQCLRCHRTFRLYPEGVTHAQTSQRVKGLAVMLYLLGLSYGATSLALEALGVYMAKSSIYEAVQAAAEKVPGLERREVFGGIRTPAVGGDLTSVKCFGEWLHLGLAVDDTTGLVLTVDELPAEDAETLKEWLQPVVDAVGAKLLVTDDADALKTAADELGMDHQVCKSHVKRNTDVLVDSLGQQAKVDQDGSLADIDVPPEQALEDLKRLEELTDSRQPEAEDELGEMHQRYVEAAPPKAGEKASIAYRLRLLFLDRWNLWRRLTRYRTWQGPHGETVDGTNNGCERAIGWWIKERYRTMRGYKRPKSAVNVSRLLAWCGNYLERGGADLAPLLT